MKLGMHARGKRQKLGMGYIVNAGIKGVHLNFERGNKGRLGSFWLNFCSKTPPYSLFPIPYSLPVAKDTI